MWRGSKLPRHCHPLWEADTISCGNRFDWKFERAAALSSSPGVWRGRIPLRTTLSQIPLKSFGFPGAESARKRFFLRGQAPVLKKSAPGATNRNLRFRLVGRKATCLPFGQATFPTRRSSASIGSREGSHPLALSRACSDGDFGFRRSRLFFCGRCFRRRERGALRSPTSPRGTGARGLRPSRALPGLDWREIWFLMEQGTVLAWRI